MTLKLSATGTRVPRSVSESVMLATAACGTSNGSGACPATTSPCRGAWAGDHIPPDYSPAAIRNFSSQF